MNSAISIPEPRTGLPLSTRILHAFPDLPTEQSWREFLTCADWPSHYTSPEFFLEPYWTGKRPFAVLATEGQKIVGVLTGLHEKNQVLSGLLARPQICFDPSSDISCTAQALARGFLEESDSAKLLTLYSWTSLDTLRDIGFRLRTMEGVVVLDLTQGPDALFKQISATGRRNIRLAQREGVEAFEAETDEDISAYYEVYCNWRKTARKEIDGDQLPFSVVADSFKLRNSRRLFLARHAGKVIAASTVRFAQGGLLENSANCSLDEYLHFKPNDLLKWKMIEWGYREGFFRFSLGGSHPFHRRSGGKIVPIYRHQLDRTWLRSHDLRETLTNIARATLQRVPPVDRAVRRVLGKHR